MPGSHENLSRVFQSVAPKVRRFAFSLGANEHEADEVVARTFEQYIKHVRRNTEGVENPESYLIAITRNEFVRLRRNEPLHTPLENHASEMTTDFEDTLSRELEYTILGGALMRLDDTDRRLLILRLIEGLSTVETAKILNLSVANTRTKLHRARQALREEYLAVFAESSRGTSCRKFVRPLAKFVAALAKEDADASIAPPHRLAKHLNDCAHCSQVLLEMRDEASMTWRIRAVVWGPVGLVALAPFTARNKSAAAALQAAAPALTVLGIAALLITGATTALQAAEERANSRLAGSGSQSGASRVSAENGSDRLLSVSPEALTLPTPAPGNTASWKVRANSSAVSSRLPLYLEIRGTMSPGTEAPLLSVTAERRLGQRAVQAVVDRVSLREGVGRALRLGTLEPGGSVTLTGSLSRAAADQDQGLGAELEFVFTTVRSLPEVDQAGAGDGDSAGELSLLDALLLALTGRPLLLTMAALGAALLLLGAIGVLLGRRLRRLRRSWHPVGPSAAEIHRADVLVSGVVSAGF